jgi:quinol monooxygenase YgiN
MSVMVIFEGKVKPDVLDRLKASLPRVFPETRAFDGCLGIQAYINDENECNIVFIEHWKSKAHYERYLAWRTETGVVAGLERAMQEPPTIRCFDLIEA